MENELELDKQLAIETDGGYSEEKIDRQIDLGISSNGTLQSGSIFSTKKKAQTLFQAQKKKEI